MRRVIELAVFLAFWGLDIFLNHGNKPWTYFVWKFSTLTWIAMNVTIAYLCCTIVKVREGFRNTLFIYAYSLDFVVVVVYWLLSSINPKLIDRMEYKSFDLNYVSTLFLHGGNLVVMTLHFLSLDNLRGATMASICKLSLATVIGFPLILFTSKSITGISVYGFLDSFTPVQVVLCFVAFDSIGILVAISFVKLFTIKEKSN